VGDDPESPIDGDTLVRNISIVLKRQPGKRVLVRGDHAVDYGTVVSAMVLLQQAGVPHVGLVTESPEE
jgi:biopolymer transport protein TolR